MIGPAQFLLNARAGLGATGAAFGGGVGLGSAITGGAGLAGGFASNAIFGSTSGIGTSLGGLGGGLGGAALLTPFLGAAGGPVGAFLGAIAGGGLESLFGGDNSGNNTGFANFNLTTGSVNAAGVGKSFNPENVSGAEALAQGLVVLAQSIGGSSFAGRVDISNNGGIKFGGTKFGTDTEAFFAAAFDDIVRGADQLSDQLKDLLISFEGTTAQTQMFAQAIISIEAASGVNTVTEAIEQFTAEQPTLIQAYNDQTDIISEMIATFDGSAESAAALNNALLTNLSLIHI